METFWINKEHNLEIVGIVSFYLLQDCQEEHLVEQVVRDQHMLCIHPGSL